MSGMAEQAQALGVTDRYFARLSGWLGKRISAFVAFLFALFAAGAMYGALVVPHFGQFGAWLLVAPMALALIAYYNRAVATMLFAGIIVIFVL
jgi:hypothetical protein